MTCISEVRINWKHLCITSLQLQSQEFPSGTLNCKAPNQQMTRSHSSKARAAQFCCSTSLTPGCGAVGCPRNRASFACRKQGESTFSTAASGLSLFSASNCIDWTGYRTRGFFFLFVCLTKLPMLEELVSLFFFYTCIYSLHIQYLPKYFTKWPCFWKEKQF